MLFLSCDQWLPAWRPRMTWEWSLKREGGSLGSELQPVILPLEETCWWERKREGEESLKEELVPYLNVRGAYWSCISPSGSSHQALPRNQGGKPLAFPQPWMLCSGGFWEREGVANSSKRWPDRWSQGRQGSTLEGRREESELGADRENLKCI